MSTFWKREMPALQAQRSTAQRAQQEVHCDAFYPQQGPMAALTVVTSRPSPQLPALPLQLYTCTATQAPHSYPPTHLRRSVSTASREDLKRVAARKRAMWAGASG